MRICVVCEGVSETTQELCATCGRPLLDTQAVHFPCRRGEEDAANPLLGVVVDGKYRIQGVLGKGGMGTVFQATHQVSLVPVALKILNPRFSARREYREYFLAEAQKAGRVIHEHTARVMDVGEAEDGTVYIAMEIVSGVTLHDCIHGETPLAPVQVVDVLLQIADALAAAHQAGLVHRDLSTRNVMVVSRQGAPFVKILDFGIAKALPILKSRGAPAAPMGFASPPYSAPEQLEGRNVDARADLYSLGVIGYEALARRFPVAGTTGKQLAEATLAGELQPLDPPPGTPVRLVRLLARLMARDPGSRPASAIEVQAELRRIRQPGSRLSRTMSVATFVIALVLMTLAFAVPKERECVIQRDSIDVTAPGLTPDLQLIRSSDIKHLRFDYAGFDANDIVVEIEQGDCRQRLAVTAEASAGVVNLVPLDYVRDELRKASRQRPVDLIFRWRERPPFGIARLRIDDDPPEVLEFEASTQLLSGQKDCYLTLRIRDRSPVRLSLACVDLSRDTADPQPLGKPIPLDPTVMQIRPVDLLGGLHQTPGPTGPVGLSVTVVDAAGNKIVSPRLDFDAMDFRVPEMLPQSLVAFHDERVAEVLVRVDDVEPGLKARVTGPGEHDTQVRDATPAGGRLLRILLPKPSTGGFVSGVYRILLIDPAGNVSREPFAGEIAFRNLDPGVRFDLGQPDPTTKALRMTELTGPERLVWDGREIQCELTCDPFYQLREVHLSRDDTRLPGELVKLLTAEPGKARIRLGAAADGNYELELLLATTASEKEKEKEQLFRKTLVVLREPLVLRLGGALAGGGQRYLPDLKNLFAEDNEKPGHPVLRQGPSWILSPDLPALVRGSVLTGSRPDDLAPVSIARLLPPLEVRIGRNLVYLDLRDVLERPVVVDVAGKPRRGRCKIADFYYYPELARPRSTEPAIQLEAGQDARLILDSPYPFTPKDHDKIVLQFPSARPIPARVSRAAEEGCVLEFVLPYHQLRLASPLDEDDLRQEGKEFEIAPDLQTPAGKQPLKLLVKTIRSALTSRRLGDLFGAAPAELGAIVMVPVLSPRGEFRDPVAEHLPWRGSFRPQPPIHVRNIRDCYLQQGELTRQQYQVIVTKALPLVPAAGEGWQQLVFPRDPKGRGRLTPGGMLPAVHGGDLPAWQERLRTGPDRPVSGVDFFQAYTLTRLAGLLAGGDPDLFRLPLGVEMELATLGADASPGRLNGSSAGADSPTYADHRRASQRMAPASWPPTRAESSTMGDRVSGERGILVGLDYGVREWVLDLPWLKHPAKGTIRGLHADYARHLRAATGFAANEDLASVAKELAELGVVRGLALGEVAWLRNVDSRGVLPPSVPGVVRTLHMRRDGGGVLPDELDPHLDRVGLRLCGGAAFIAKVRSR